MAEAPHSLRIFLCHSSGDKQAVRDLYRRLRADGFDPWLDEENLLPGQDWQREIPEAVSTADVVLVCLSHNSITKRGYVHKEVGYALDAADEQPEGAIYLIPLKLEECDMPQRLRRWHWVNYYEAGGYEKLLSALYRRAAELGVVINTAPSTSNPHFQSLSTSYIGRAFQNARLAFKGQKLKPPIVISFVGRFGVGKSSLMNALTQGDYIPESADVTTAGIMGSYRWHESFYLIDMPGLGNYARERESELDRQIQEKSGLILYVLDSASRFTSDDLEGV